MSNNQPIKLAILWHMHQPDYRRPRTDYMVMPWVRLHALKDYLDMPLAAARYDNVKITFNLVPSLIDQLQSYANGGSDPHMDLSLFPADSLDDDQKKEILLTFFNVPEKTMIQPYKRYNQLFKKAVENINQEILPRLFTSEEIRDIQVWSNLCWIDPVFRNEPVIKELFDRKQHYREEDKQNLFQWQREFIKKIIPTYKQLYAEKKIDISFTPYYHPILPLLCDNETAKAALPEMKLPQHKFKHPEDARIQITKSKELFQQLFDAELKGMWPSEGSVSDEALMLIKENGIKWAATDEEILYQSLKSVGKECLQCAKYSIYEYNGLKLFFRDHALSDRVGFVYSGMSADAAVDDFIGNVKRVREHCIDRLDETVVTVILDGENAWEYFPNDGTEFLDKLYNRLSEDTQIETVTLSEVSEKVVSQNIEKVFPGSWINHNFKIWIGHTEDNTAWDLLSETRKDLVYFIEEHPQFNKDIIAQAWEQIYRAEGSDWCWWYGEEHRGPQNEQFDKIFREHLMAVYDLLEIPVPPKLYRKIYDDIETIEAVTPDAMITPEIDGRQTYFFEWASAGMINNLGGGVMHRVDKHIAKIMYAYDYDRFYIRLDFVNKKHVKSLKKPVCRLSLFLPEEKVFDLSLDIDKEDNKYEPGLEYAFDDILELGIERKTISTEGFGKFKMSVLLMDGEFEIESCPENEPLEIDLPEQGQEMFWM